jgi:hypothetical protein
MVASLHSLGTAKSTQTPAREAQGGNTVPMLVKQIGLKSGKLELFGAIVACGTTVKAYEAPQAG